MAAKRPQTFAKRARELAVKEKRERKRAKKAEAAAERAAGIEGNAGQLEGDDVEGGIDAGESIDPTAEPADT
jgi:hypothetical protein